VKGSLAGGQVGYNWQTGNIVLGAEFSADWADLTSNYASTSFPAGNFNPHVTSAYTATGRVGWAFDRFLAYGKGGAAFATETYLNTCNGLVGGGVCLPVGAIAAHASETRVGFTVGAGLEYLLTRNLSLAVEYSFLDFGNRNTTFAFAPAYGFGCGSGVACPLKINETVSTVSGRLNWHFGG
jgi:outer membrane immunogenic protein